MRSPKREPRSRDSFLLSLSIAIPPARFLVNRGIFPLPPSRMQSHHRCRAASSFLRSPRERGREGGSAPVFRRWNFIFIRVLRVRTRNGCDDIANTPRFPARAEDWAKRSWRGGRKTERRLPFVSGYPPRWFFSSREARPESVDLRREIHANRSQIPRNF